MLHTEITRVFARRTMGLTFFLGMSLMANAQEKQSVSGRIVDANGNGVPYASVEFNHSNKALSDATLSDENGNFNLNIALGTYQISIDAVGFQSKSFETTLNKSTNIGNISLVAVASSKSKEKEIETLVITAKSPQPYKVELDKKVYNVEQDLTSKGGTLQDVLNNVPSVSVDTDGSVSMRGNSNVKFLINGKPSSTLGITDDNSNALKSIPADQIERIEIITNPSSKFEAEGTAGILNIILKKSTALGFNGSVNGSIGYHPSSRLNANLSWNYGKWTWFFNGGGAIMNPKSDTTSEILYKNTGEHLDMNNSSQSEIKSYVFTSGFTYNITDKTSANASFAINNMFMEPETSQLNVSTLTGTTYRNSSGLNENKNIQVDAGLEHKFNTRGHILSLSGSFQDSKNNSNSSIFDNRNASQTLYQYLNIADFSQKLWIGKLDYELPIGEESKLEAGARYDYKQNEISNFYAGNNNSSLIVFSDVTGDNSYTEKTASLYLQFKSKIDRLGYQLGIRNENIYMDIQTNGGILGQVQKSKNYNQFFPSVFLSYDITDKSQLSFNYSRRIKRPRSFEMIPTMRLQNEPNRFMGNADLNPSFVNSFEFSYNYSRNKWNFNPTLYYQRTTDDVSIVTEERSYINPINQQATEYILSTPYNLGSEDRYGLDLNYSVNPVSWLRLFGNVNIFRYKNETTYNNHTVSNEGNSTMARLTAAFRLDKTLNIQLQGHFRGGQKTYTTTRKDSYALNFGVSKNLWNNTATLSFNIQDILNSRKMRVYTDTDSFTRYAEMQMMPRQFTLSFSYRFKNANAKEQKNSSPTRAEQNLNDDSAREEVL